MDNGMNRNKELIKAMVLSLQTQIDQLKELTDSEIPDKKPCYSAREVAQIEEKSSKTVVNRCYEGYYSGARKKDGKWIIPYETVAQLPEAE